MKIHGLQPKTAAFTMVEIAIALGVIAFALVAIVGILPTGLNVERENREETLINQEGPYFMEAVRGGSKGLDILTNYVDSIAITTTDPAGIIAHYRYENNPGVVTVIGGTNCNGNMTNASWIIGLLSRPKYWPPGWTNKIDAHVRAMSGTAVEQGTGARDMSFNYSIFPELIPVNFHAFDPSLTNSFATNVFINTLQTNLHEVRLNFRWPLYPNGSVGNGRKIYRSYVGGRISSANSPDGTTELFFQHQENFVTSQ
ncbi:MAG: hypothetical protein JWM68_5051 [Verrucomicrobiales bacterium]|nr:hypothetical protein [Verrucomicrobiales bacterium]